VLLQAPQQTSGGDVAAGVRARAGAGRGLRLLARQALLDRMPKRVFVALIDLILIV
jgi:hypothetical protein